MSNFAQKKLASRPRTERSKNCVTIPPPPINTYIWGARNFGKAAVKVFEQAEQKINGIIDSNPALQGKEKYGYRVFAPREILALPKENLQIVVAVDENEEIISILKVFGVNFTTKFTFIPSSIENFQKKFPNKQIEKIPNAFSSKLFLIKNANLMSMKYNISDNYLIHFDGSFVFDICSFINNSDFPRNNSKEIKLHSACNMASVDLSYNYWHFTDCLPRVIALESVGFKGVYITNGGTHKYVDEILNLLGVPSSRIIHKEPDTNYIVEKFYTSDVKSFLGGFGKNGKFFEKLREKVFHNIKNINEDKYPKRIYVSRIGVRKILNEKEVLEMLKKYKFKVIVPENLSVAEQIKYFHNAETVVCPHGANSTNVVYMNPHSNFLEIFPAHYVRPCMFGAIDFLKLNYKMFVTSSIDKNLGISTNKNFNVNVGHLEVMLNTMIGNKN